MRIKEQETRLALQEYDDDDDDDDPAATGILCITFKGLLLKIFTRFVVEIY